MPWPWQWEQRWTDENDLAHDLHLRHAEHLRVAGRVAAALPVLRVALHNVHHSVRLLARDGAPVLNVHAVPHAAQLVVVVAKELANVPHHLGGARVQVEALHRHRHGAVHGRGNNHAHNLLALTQVRVAGHGAHNSILPLGRLAPRRGGPGAPVGPVALSWRGDSAPQKRPGRVEEVRV
jgi:hypothetical protein